MNDNLENALKIYLQNNLSNKRYYHILSVYETAIKLGVLYHENIEKIKIAALGHDITKEMNKQKEKLIMDKYFSQEEVYQIYPAWHSYSATIFLQNKFNITDSQILNAIKYHTLGHIDMDNLAKIIYIADFIEPTRKTPNLSYYQDLIFKFNYELDKVLYLILKDSLKYLRSKNNYIPQQSLALLTVLEQHYENEK